MQDALTAGREALERHAWREAYEHLVEADRSESLSADDLELLAKAAWWSGHGEETIDAMERAYEAHLGAGNRSRAALMTFELVRQHMGRQAYPVAMGWFARAERLLADEPDSLGHGYLAFMRGNAAMMQGDFDAVLSQFTKSLDIGTRFGDRDLQAMSLLNSGMVLCEQGKLAEGQALMDEAMVAAVAGELRPETTGDIYCTTIAACSRRADYRRAADWTEATMRWCQRRAISGFPGVCRVHRAQIFRLRGAWSTAEQEARLACDEFPRFNMSTGVGFGLLEIAEVRRRMGDFPGAEDAYRQAHEFGRNPQPGLSLVRLAQGNVEAAAAGVRGALAEESSDLDRMKLLAAHVEIAIAGEDVETARSAVEELESIATVFDTSALHAVAAGARGAVRIAEGNPKEAIRDLRRAGQGWQEVDAPYEAAEVRMLLGEAYRALGDEEAALLELRAAWATFERLGGEPKARRAAELLGDEVRTSRSPGERVSRAFMFTDIVGSTDLVGVIGDDAWESLISWHDQTLRSLFAQHGGEVAHHTGDGFFVAFPDARSAIDCAVAIQRSLVEHRRSYGFAPGVRIGVHAAEATRRGQDYSGKEVHKAARIVALADGGEIVTTEETAAAQRLRFAVSEPRVVELKGISEPVRVVAVQWR